MSLSRVSVPVGTLKKNESFVISLNGSPSSIIRKVVLVQPLTVLSDSSNGFKTLSIITKVFPFNLS